MVDHEARALAASALADVLEALPADARLAQVVDAAQDVVGLVFGDSFRVVPVLAPDGGPDPFAEAVDRPAFPAPAPSACCGASSATWPPCGPR